MTIYFGLPEQLDKLPDKTVIVDDHGQTWQKHAVHPIDTMSHATDAWYQPGSETPRLSAEIDFPARLLDDGL